MFETYHQLLFMFEHLIKYKGKYCIPLYSFIPLMLIICLQLSFMTLVVVHLLLIIGFIVVCFVGS